ncbi:MAG: NUDIX domain-containing protein, partial [Limnohabitans sp.]
MADQSDAHLIETKLKGQALFSGSFLHAFLDTVALPDGTQATREYVVHPGAVMVVPLLELPGQPLQLVMERQFRYPVQQVMLEFPAGKLDPRESTLQCAKRELFEETGYSAKQWAKAGVMHPVISYSTEFIEIWFAIGDFAFEAGFLQCFRCHGDDFQKLTRVELTLTQAEV